MSWRCWGKAREDKDALAFYAASGAVGRTVIAPPNLDAEMTRILRAGSDATMKNAAFLADTEWLSWSGGIENKEDHVINATPGSGSSMRRQLGDSVKGTTPMILSITPLQSIKLIALKLEELINRDGKNCCRRGVKNAPARFQRPAYQKCADAIARKALNIIMKPNPKQ